MEYQQDLRNLASNKNGPQVIYQKLLLEIERLASISNPKNEDDEIEAVRQQAFEVLSTIKNKIEENIISLEKNTDWNTFTIAFYGETGAGKSTLIETLRILMSEPSKVADRARFSSAQVQLKNLGAKLQKNRNTEQKILNELETLKENLQDLEKNWVEQARKQESLQERGIEK
ncbi:50S ribosome-binding GTPase [Lactococcus lactis]|nr:50S ribosome-binding GTPase [Lactococcus lactis]